MKKTKANTVVKTLSWQDNLPVQQLLTVIAKIIVDEYIETAKEHTGLFTTRLRPKAMPQQEGKG